MSLTASQSNMGARLSKSQIRLTVCGVLLAMFLGTLSQGIVAPALTTMAADLSSRWDPAWIITAYLVAGTASTPIFGKLCDIWGRRPTLALALVSFVIGSIGCALARTMPLMIAGRAVQGIGGGALIVLALVIVADVVAPRERGRYQPYMTTTFVVGGLAGPMLGGFLAEHYHWSVIFWVCALLGVAALAVGEVTLKRHIVRGQPQSIDLIGATLMILASVSSLAAVGGHGENYPTLSLAVAAVILWLGFAWRLATTEAPLIPLHILRLPLALNGTLSATFATAVLLILMTFLPAYLQYGMGLSVSASGMALAPMIAGTAIGSVAAGQTMVYRTRYRRVGEYGMLLAAAASTAAALMVGRSPPFWLMEALVITMSIGIGTITPITTFSIQNAVERHELGIVTSTNNFVRQLLGTMIVAIMGALLLRFGALNEATSHAEDFSVLFWASTASLIAAYLFLLGMEERTLRSDEPANESGR